MTPPTGDLLLQVDIVLLEDFCQPTRGTDEAAGWDVYAREAMEIQNGKTGLIPLGIKIAMPRGWCTQLCPRSSWSKRGDLALLGTIDSDYRGELCAIAMKPHRTWPWRGSIKINRGDKVGQLSFHRVPVVTWRKVANLPASGRGENGFGSTGT